ncbi:MAG TPA: DUF2207 domain-containing protein [Thermoprotei archaeon]|nr:DUF2207 domain-containing protein [Thermoprotei archaeon]
MYRGKILIPLILILLAIAVVFRNIHGQTLIYHIEKFHMIDYVEKDGSMHITYNITVMVDAGAIRRYLSVGIFGPDFEVIEAREIETHTSISYRKEVSGDKYYVYLTPSKPIYDGESRTFLLKIILKNHIYEDEKNPGNAGFILKFYPWKLSTGEYTVTKEFKIKVILPEGVKKDEVKNYPDYDNIFIENNRIVLYWERYNLKEIFEVGVSFPEKYVENIVRPSQPSIIDQILDSIFTLLESDICGGLCCIGMFFILIFSLATGISRFRSEYISPKFSIEALGPRKGLTAVEAAYLLEQPYEKVLTMILFGMLKKGVIRIKSTAPLLLEKTESKVRLRYYERSFLKCIKEDGSLDKNCLAKTLTLIDKTLSRKLRGYSYIETKKYYENIVKKAWDQVKKAGTPEIAFKRFDENIDWLMLDPKFREKSVEIYPTTVYIPPYYWYWNLPTIRGYEEKPVNIVDVADNIATSLEQTSASIASTIEDIADKITRTITGETGRESKPVFRTSSCACACVSCACACACVSCACACASGGAG